MNRQTNQRWCVARKRTESSQKQLHKCLIVFAVLEHCGKFYISGEKSTGLRADYVCSHNENHAELVTWLLILDWFSSVLFIDAPWAQAVVCSTWFTPGHTTKVNFWNLLTFSGNTPSPLDTYDTGLCRLPCTKTENLFLLLWSHHRDYFAHWGCLEHICFVQAYAPELFSLLCDSPCFWSVDVRLCVVQIACAARNHPVAMASCSDNSHRMN